MGTSTSKSLNSSFSSSNSSIKSLSSPRFALLLLKRARAQYGAELDFQKVFTCPCLVTNYDINNPGDNYIVYVNDLFCRMTGYNRKFILGKDPRFLQGEYTDIHVTYKLKQQIERGVVVDSTPIINYTKKGVPFLSIMTLYPIYNPENYEIEHYVAIYRNSSNLNNSLHGSFSRSSLPPIPEAVYESLEDNTELSYQFHSSSSPARLRSVSDSDSITPSDFSDLVKELQILREK